MTYRPWRDAWHDVLYGSDGFYRRATPRDHFRTSAQTGAVFGSAVLALVERHGVDGVLDVGAGSGELLAALHDLAPGLRLCGVELRPRPAWLPAAVTWTPHVPDRWQGLVIANELLDNVACEVVEVDATGLCRQVEVDVTDGSERLGEPAADDTLAWLDRWWPVCEPGQRAEVGLARDQRWRDITGRVHGPAVAIDYGHRRHARPPRGTVMTYADGRAVPPGPLVGKDVTAHVAVDSVAEAVGGDLVRQRDALRGLGLTTALPPHALASTHPRRYAQALAASTRAGVVMARPGLGDLWWIASS